MDDGHLPAGRRERKKVQTREALRTAARALFAEQGVADTSIEQITEAADVSERTFFRYFESKYDLLLPDLAALFAAIEAALTARPAGEPPLDAYLAAVTTVLAEQSDQVAGILTVAPGLDPADAAVATRLLRVFLSWEERLTQLFRERLRGTGPADEQLALQATVSAGVAIAGTRAVVRLLREHPETTPARRRELLPRVFAVIRAGCAPAAVD